MKLPTSFVPNEDQGYVFAVIIMPDAASLDRTPGRGRAGGRDVREDPGVENRAMITGYSLIDSGFKTNAATFFVTLQRLQGALRDDRNRARAERAHGPGHAPQGGAGDRGATVFPVPPPPIPGIGTTGGFEFWIQDTGAGEPARLDDLTQQVIRQASARPELTGLHTTFRATTQQLRADVDREKASCSACRWRTSTARSRRSSAR